MNNKEKLLLVSNILKNILDREYLSSYKLAKTIGLSEKTVKKILENKGSRINKTTIEKLLVSKMINKLEKNQLETCIYNSGKTISKNKSMPDYNSLLNTLHKLIEENEKLKAQLNLAKEFKNTSNGYLERRKEGVFNTNMETRTFLISKMWDFNDTVYKKWAEMKLLLDINGVEENKKIKKGLQSVMSTLKNVIEYIEKLTFDKNYEEVEILTEDK
jgi:hypothetical protein|nr:MAG TPA: ATP-dependent target DNA activator B [Caudoviricetes sp.]